MQIDNILILAIEKSFNNKKEMIGVAKIIIKD